MYKPTALLVQRRKYDEPDLLEEFESIAKTAGYSILGFFDVVSPPSARFGIGSGKVEEIATWIEINEPDVVLFSHMLSSSQIYRLMEAWDVEVRDRNQVILEIFDKHAQTQQAKLQIEQARLRYELPFERHQIRKRLQKEHTGDRPIAEQIGAGEDLLNMRIKEIRRRIAIIQKKLEKIAQVQELKKQKRVSKGFLEVTLAGYTNAGKSTLHRAMTGSTVEIADKLFTTLSTKTAEFDLPGRQVVLSDSVGFISDLPSSLLDAFHTTLMEIGDADVIVLVIDASDSIPEMIRKANASRDTFKEVGVNGIPIIVALNKIDLIEKEQVSERISILSTEYDQIIPISAKEQIALNVLIQAIEAELPPLSLYRLELDYGDESMSLISWLHEVGDVEVEDYKTGNIHVEAYLPLSVAQKLAKTLPQGTFTMIE
ncbi:MAG: GTPase HflX [Candidatus Thorarchaeota archaeon]|nr:MAG: GTPase HflX [Candidatus Thorarchaeota archaeon]